MTTCAWCDREMNIRPPDARDGVEHKTCRRHLEMLRAEALRLRNIYAVEDAMSKEAR